MKIVGSGHSPAFWAPQPEPAGRADPRAV